MPRPSDTYAHSQFAPVEPPDSDPSKAGSVRCVHCKTWTGAGRSLERKKAHLLRCLQYGEWRAAGNGEELQPTQSYAKRSSVVWQSSPGSTSSVQNPDELVHSALAFLSPPPEGFRPLASPSRTDRFAARLITIARLDLMRMPLALPSC